MNMTFSILGFIGGLLCCVGDILLDFKGKENQKLGQLKMIDSQWIKMADWRFGVSIFLALFGDVFVGLGIFSLAIQIHDLNNILSSIMMICGYVGAVGGFFIHTFLCIQPIIYKRIMEKDDFALAEKTLNSLYKMILLPFLITYIILMIPSICTMIAILIGYLDVPLYFVFCNSVVFLIIGVALRKIKYDWFYDLPGIIMPSLGLAMLGLIGIIHLL